MPVYFMISNGTCQEFLPPEHGTAKTIHIDGHEVTGEHDWPSQLSPEISPASGRTSNEEYGIDDAQIGLGSGKGHHETGHYREQEADQLQHESPGI